MSRGREPVEPDTKDWVWVVRRRCDQCGLNAAMVDPADVARHVPQNAASWTQVLTQSGVGERPDAGTWSALEYACHVRDVHTVFGGRLRQMLDQDDARFTDWNQDLAAAQGDYGRQDPAVVAAELTDAAARTAALFGSVTAGQWQRTGRRSDGAGFTVETLARYYLHDVEHHLWDVTGRRSTVSAAAAGAVPEPGDGTVLVCCSHGTADADGQRAVASLVSAVAAARPEVQVRPAFVDVQEPAVADVVHAAAPGARRVVVVPLLLSAGYHVHVDIARAVAGHKVAVASAALGPDARLADLLVDRLREAGGRDGDSVVVAAAGSSDPRAAADVEAVTSLLQQRWQGPVTVGYGSSRDPRVADAVHQARVHAPAARVLVAAYLLAPGYFWSVLQQTGADVVTAPLVPVPSGGDPAVDPRLVQLVLDRMDTALG